MEKKLFVCDCYAAVSSHHEHFFLEHNMLAVFTLPKSSVKEVRESYDSETHIKAVTEAINIPFYRKM